MDNLLLRSRYMLRGCCNKGLQFLKPNFRSHPLNYLFVVLFLWLGFYSATVFASERYQGSQLGFTAWGSSVTSVMNAILSHNYPGAYTLCPAKDGGNMHAFSTSANGSCASVYYITVYKMTDCPTGQEPDSLTGVCSVPQVDCPVAGTKYTLGFALSSGSAITIGDKKSLDGCTLEVNWRTVDCYESPSGSADCKMIDGYIYTGEADPVGENSSPPVVDPNGPVPVDIPDSEPLADGKNLQPETTETIIQDTVVETMPDGTTVRQDVTTTITTKGIGTNIETTTEEKKIVRDNGITKTQTTTTTTTTNPDGSKSIKTVTDTSYDQSDKELIIVKNADGSISIVKNEGFKGSSKTTNTKNYDADGKKTSETESKEKTGDGDESAGKYCEENPDAIDCKKKAGAIEGGFYKPEEKTLESVFKGFKTKLDESDIGKALGGFYEVNVGGTCPTFSTQVFGWSVVIDQQCSSIMLNALMLAGYVILATASFFAFRIAFL